MKTYKMMLPLLFSVCIVLSCNNNNSEKGNPVADTTGTNPTKQSLDYQPDQSQIIPVTDSSNVAGTDTINGSVATPNTGTVKSYNETKGKDSSKQ